LGCLQELTKRFTGLSACIEFVINCRHDYFTQRRLTQETGTQWIADKFKAHGPKPHSVFPCGVEVMVEHSQPNSELVGPLCMICYGKLLRASTYATKKAAKMLKTGIRNVKTRLPIQACVRAQFKGVSFTKPELNVHQYLEEQFLPVYAQHMPTKEHVRELNPIPRQTIFAWYQTWACAIGTPVQDQGCCSVFRRVWSSDWFADVVMRTSKTVGKDCVGHDCGNVNCPMRYGCTHELVAMNNKAQHPSEKIAVRDLKTEHSNFHARDKGAYEHNKIEGAKDGK
jgi:hypothetical protein